MRYRHVCAPRRAGDACSMRYGRALHKREAAVPLAPGHASTCQPCPSLREVGCACSAPARHCARSLWERGPARALRTRARAAPCWRHSLFERFGRALHERDAAYPSAPGLCSHVPALPLTSRGMGCASCSALARHCARSHWGRGPARALPTRARAAPCWRHSLHALRKRTARATSRRSFGAKPCSHVPALPLTSRGRLRV